MTRTDIPQGTVAIRTAGRILAPRRFAPGTLSSAIGLGFIAIVVVGAVLAPVITPYYPDSIDLQSPLSPPSAEHLLGTDSAGRDLLTRLLYGARTGLLAPLGVVLISVAVGVPLGMIAAAFGGLTDTIISRALDMVLSFPTLLLAIMAVAIFGKGEIVVVGALAIAYIPAVARLTRSLTLGEQEREYVSAYRVLGFGRPVIYGKHILPNILPVTISNAVVHFGYALVDLAVLSYLGMGVQPPTADWGNMVYEGQQALLQGSAYQSFFAALAIVLTVMAFNVVGMRFSNRMGVQA